MHDGTSPALRRGYRAVARDDAYNGRVAMTPSQGNSWAVYYVPRGVDCASLDTNYQHFCQFVTLYNSDTSCDFTNAVKGASDNSQNALEWHLSDSRLTTNFDARFMGKIQASNCKTVTISGVERQPVDYAPRTTQQIADVSALFLAVAVSMALFVGVRRLLGMLHSAIRARG